MKGGAAGMKFTLGMAGLAIGVEAAHSETEAYCRGYHTAGPPDFTVACTKEAMEREKKRSGWTADEAELERLAMQREIAERLPEYGCVLIRATAVAVDGEGYVFAALSGRGKTTHADVYLEKFGKRAEMINDGQPVLKITEDGLWVCGTPWRERRRQGSSASVPVRGICFLRRGNTTSMIALNREDGLMQLQSQCYRPEDPEAFRSTQKLLKEVTERCGLYLMTSYKASPESAAMSYDGMTMTGMRMTG